MRNIISIVLMIFISFSLVISDAHAKRFGGGRSFGTYRSSSAFTRAKPAAPFQNTVSPNRNRWLGPLAGLAAGGLLASLFMGHGIASGMMSWLLIAGIAMLLLNLLRGFSRHKIQSSPSGQVYQFHPQQQEQYGGSIQNIHDGAINFYPADFNKAEFLRFAQVQFIRLQAAYDQKNLQDLANFTTPEVYAEVKMQLQERGDVVNQTDVVTVVADLLDVSKEFQETTATVKFSGLIKEDTQLPATQFDEIWHFYKKYEGAAWLVSGVQQTA